MTTGRKLAILNRLILAVMVWDTEDDRANSDGLAQELEWVLLNHVEMVGVSKSIDGRLRENLPL